jgi:hypothetical protein
VLTTVVPMSREADIWVGCICVMNWPEPWPPLCAMVGGVAGAVGCAAPPAPGCMAEEPDVVVPVPDAAGRSVPPDGGAGVVWAKAGATAKAVATRQAAMCFFSIVFS